MAITPKPKKRELKAAAETQDIDPVLLAEIQTKVTQLDGLQKTVKTLYEQMEPLENWLIEILLHHPEGVTLSDGRLVGLKDNHKDPKTGAFKNKAFKASMHSHYEVEVRQA